MSQILSPSHKRPWLTKNLVVLSAISLTQDAASELMYPLLPLFLTGVLAAPAIVVGAVEGAADVAAGVAKYFSGKRSDTRGAKPFITSGYALAGAGKILVATSVAWPTVLLGRVVDRIGKGIRSAPRDAMITTGIEPEHYSKALGFHRSADTLGAVIGPLVALVGLHFANGDLRKVMWWAVVPAVISVLLTLVIKETRQVSSIASDSIKQPLPKIFWNTARPLIIFSVFNLPDTLLILRLSQIGLSVQTVVLAYVGFNFVYTLAAYPAGILASKLRPHSVYSIGLLMCGVSYIALGHITTQGPWLYFFVALFGLFPAFTDGIGKAIIALRTPSEIHGQAQGMFQSLSGGGVLIAGLWAGAIWNLDGGKGTLPFTIAGVCALMCGLILSRMRNGYANS